MLLLSITRQDLTFWLETNLSLLLAYVPYEIKIEVIRRTYLLLNPVIEERHCPIRRLSDNTIVIHQVTTLQLPLWYYNTSGYMGIYKLVYFHHSISNKSKNNFALIGSTLHVLSHICVFGLSLNLNVWLQWIISSEKRVVITEKLFLGVYRRVIAYILNATIYKSHESQASSSIFSKLVIRLLEGFYGLSNLPQVVFVSPAFPHIWQWVKATTSKE